MPTPCSPWPLGKLCPFGPLRLPIDLVWALSFMALLFPILAAWCKRGFRLSSSFSDVPYIVTTCMPVFSQPGLVSSILSVFATFKPMPSGFLCYLAGVALFVLTVEIHCYIVWSGGILCCFLCSPSALWTSATRVRFKVVQGLWCTCGMPLLRCLHLQVFLLRCGQKILKRDQ